MLSIFMNVMDEMGMYEIVKPIFRGRRLNSPGARLLGSEEEGDTNSARTEWNNLIVRWARVLNCFPLDGGSNDLR
jgi:hypothetical protein